MLFLLLLLNVSFALKFFFNSNFLTQITFAVLQETPTGSNLSSAVQSGQQVLPTQSGTDYPVMTLNRKNSINSLQYSTSSGYNSQYTTPACSEDTISSQGELTSLWYFFIYFSLFLCLFLAVSDTGYNSVENYDVSSATTNNTYSTVPRNYHHSNRSNSLSHSTNLRRASTNGLPSSGSKLYLQIFRIAVMCTYLWTNWFGNSPLHDI